MNTKLILPLIVAGASTIAIMVAVNSVVQKGERAEQARIDKAKAKADYDALVNRVELILRSIGLEFSKEIIKTNFT